MFGVLTIICILLLSIVDADHTADAIGMFVGLCTGTQSQHWLKGTAQLVHTDCKGEKTSIVLELYVTSWFNDHIFRKILWTNI